MKEYNMKKWIYKNHDKNEKALIPRMRQDSYKISIHKMLPSGPLTYIDICTHIMLTLKTRLHPSIYIKGTEKERKIFNWGTELYGVKKGKKLKVLWMHFAYKCLIEVLLRARSGELGNAVRINTKYIGFSELFDSDKNDNEDLIRFKEE